MSNKFDQKVLRGITPSRAKPYPRDSNPPPPPDSLPTKPDETQEEKIEREITVHINGKTLQIVEVDGDIHFADKDDGHGLSVTKQGDVIIVSGAGGNGKACGARFMVNAKGGHMYKGGPIVTEAVATEGGASGTDSTQEKQNPSTGETTTTNAGTNGVACSATYYGDHTEECHGNVHIRGRNITLDAVDSLTLIGGTQINIQGGPSGGGNITLTSGQIKIDTATYTEKISANKIIEGTPETTIYGIDPRTNTSTIGWYNVNSNITGDYKLAVGGCMEVMVAGAPPPVPTNALIKNRTVGYSLTVTAGSMNLTTIAGSALIAIGGLAFPDKDSIKPGSLDIQALTSLGISAGKDLPKLSIAPSAGDVNIRALTKVDVNATTDINIAAVKEISIKSTTKDISILATAGKIYLN